MRHPSDEPTTLIQCIEYDWALCFGCRVCGHKASWGALDLIERFRDQLRATVSAVHDAVADHCGQRPVFYMRQGAGMMAWDGPDLQKSISDPFAWRDTRLRAFLADQGLPLDHADERRAVGQAILAA
jgi:hypothetical protein